MASSLDQITRSCADCRELIVQLLQARDELERSLEQSPGTPRAAVLQDKVRKLQAATEARFLRAMEALTGGRHA